VGDQRVHQLRANRCRRSDQPDRSQNATAAAAAGVKAQPNAECLAMQRELMLQVQGLQLPPNFLDQVGGFRGLGGGFKGGLRRGWFCVVGGVAIISTGSPTNAPISLTSLQPTTTTAQIPLP